MPLQLQFSGLSKSWLLVSNQGSVQSKGQHISSFQLAWAPQPLRALISTSLSDRDVCVEAVYRTTSLSTTVTELPSNSYGKRVCE